MDTFIRFRAFPFIFNNFSSAIEMVMQSLTYSVSYQLIFVCETLRSPWKNAIWSWYITLFTCYWIQFASILLKIFASTFLRDIDYSFLVMPLSGLETRTILASQNKEGKQSLFYIFFWKSLWGIGINSSVKNGWNLPVKPAELFFVERFWSLIQFEEFFHFI